MLVLQEEFRDFVITTPSQNVLGTVQPVHADVSTRDPQLIKLLKKRSGDLIAGRTPQEAVENAKRYIDELLARA